MLPFLAGINTKIMIALAAVIAVISIAFYFYYKSSQNEIKTLHENQAKLELSFQVQKEATESLKTQMRVQKQELGRLEKDMNQIEKSNSDLARLFSEHDLGRLADGKPILIERLANRATEKLFKEFEEITDPRSYYSEKSETENVVE